VRQLLTPEELIGSIRSASVYRERAGTVSEERKAGLEKPRFFREKVFRFLDFFGFLFF